MTTFPVLRRGSYGDLVQKIQFGLAALSFQPGPADKSYGPLTERAVAVFQYSRQLYWDGIAGPLTIPRYNQALEDNAGQMGRPEILAYRIPGSFTALDPANPLVTNPLLKVEPKLIYKPHDFDDGPRGYTFDRRCRLREDVIPDLEGFHKAVRELGGKLTLDRGGGKRAIAAGETQYLSTTSFLYLGLAFHLHPCNGMQNPHTDDYLMTSTEGDPRWTVWCRSSKFLPKRSLKAWSLLNPSNRRGKGYTQLYQTEVSGSFFNLTELASEFGFRPIPRSPLFPLGYSYHGANWWHFRWERGLDYGVTTFGSELRKGYRLERIRQWFAPWEQVKNLRFGQEWL